MKKRKIILCFALAFAILLGTFETDIQATETDVQPSAETESIYEEEFIIPLKRNERFYGNVKLIVKVIYSITDKRGEILDVRHEDLNKDAYTITCDPDYSGAHGEVTFAVGGLKWTGYIQLYINNGNIVFITWDENGNKIIYN